MAGPRDRYQQEIASGHWLDDPAQQVVIDHLQQRYERLVDQQTRRRWPWQKKRQIKGIYLVGPVGRGKTRLMDLFCEALQRAEVPVWRIHFHRFMAKTHDRLAEIQGQSNPLSQIADEISDRARVLCFDEFHVEDIGDAMILGELLHHLFSRGMTLITTSNTLPDDLYHDGLQRARFVPAIHEIKRYCEIVSVDARQDYRLRQLTQAPTYFYPTTVETLASMDERYRTLSGEVACEGQCQVGDRWIDTLGQSKNVIWFRFHALCETPRAPRDYIELVERHETILVSEIPILGAEDSDAAKRFTHFVDEAYDRRAKLILQAMAPAHELYQGKRLRHAFDRTVSRLIEMQSHDYLERPWNKSTT